MKCIDCGHEQDVGKFCGLCGGELVSVDDAKASSVTDESVDGSSDRVEDVSEVEDEVASGQEAVQTGQSSESFDRVVETSKEFGSFFQRFLKTPSLALSSERHQLTHSVINLVLLALLFTLTMFRVTKVLIDFSFFNHGSFAFYSFVAIVLAMLVVIVVLFGLNKFFGDESVTFEKVVSIYGVFMVPAVIVMALALILALIKSIKFAIYLLIFSFLLAVFIIPAFIATYYVVKFPKNIDPLYSFLIFVVVTIGLLMIVNNVVLDSFSDDFSEYFNDFIFGGFDYYW